MNRVDASTNYNHLNSLLEDLPKNSITQAALIAIQNQTDLPRICSPKIRCQIQILKEAYDEESTDLRIKELFATHIRKEEPRSFFSYLDSINVFKKTPPECLKDFSFEEKTIILDLEQLYEITDSLVALEMIIQYAESMSFEEMQKWRNLSSSLILEKNITFIDRMIPHGLKPSKEGLITFYLTAIGATKLNCLEEIKSMIPQGLNAESTHQLISYLSMAVAEKTLNESISLLRLIRLMIPDCLPAEKRCSITSNLAQIAINKSFEESRNILELIKKSMTLEGVTIERRYSITSNFSAMTHNKSFEEAKEIFKLINMMLEGLPFEAKSSISSDLALVLTNYYFQEAKDILELIKKLIPEGLSSENRYVISLHLARANYNKSYQESKLSFELISNTIPAGLPPKETYLITTNLAAAVFKKSFEDSKEIFELMKNLIPDDLSPEKRFLVTSNLALAVHNKSAEESKVILELIKNIVPEGLVLEERYVITANLIKIANNSFEESLDLLTQISRMTLNCLPVEKRFSITSNLAQIAINKSFQESRNILELIRNMIPEGLTVEKRYSSTSNFSAMTHNKSFEEAKEIFKLINMMLEGLPFEAKSSISSDLALVLTNYYFQEAKDILELITKLIPEGLSSENRHVISLHLAQVNYNKSYQESKLSFELISNTIPAGLPPKETYLITTNLAAAVFKKSFEKSKEIFELMKNLIPDDLSSEKRFLVTSNLALAVHNKSAEESKAILELIKNIIPEGLTPLDRHPFLLNSTNAIINKSFQESKEIFDRIKRMIPENLSPMEGYPIVSNFAAAIYDQSFQESLDLLDFVSSMIPENSSANRKLFLISSFAEVLKEGSLQKSKEFLVFLRGMIPKTLFTKEEFPDLLLSLIKSFNKIPKHLRLPYGQLITDLHLLRKEDSFTEINSFLEFFLLAELSEKTTYENFHESLKNQLFHFQKNNPATALSLSEKIFAWQKQLNIADDDFLMQAAIQIIMLESNQIKPYRVQAHIKKYKLDYPIFLPATELTPIVTLPSLPDEDQAQFSLSLEGLQKGLQLVQKEEKTLGELKAWIAERNQFHQAKNPRAPLLSPTIFLDRLSQIQSKLQSLYNNQRNEIQAKQLQDIQLIYLNFSDSTRLVPKLMSQSLKGEDSLSIPKNLQKLYAIADAILNESTDPSPEDPSFSNQEIITMTWLRLIQHCSTGQDEGISNLHYDLQISNKIARRTIDENPATEETEQDLAFFIQKAMADVLESPQTLKLFNVSEKEMEQQVHQIQFLKNMIGFECGLNHEETMDTYPLNISKSLFQYDRKHILEVFFKELSLYLPTALRSSINSQSSELKAKRYNILQQFFSHHHIDPRKAWQIEVIPPLVCFKGENSAVSINANVAARCISLVPPKPTLWSIEEDHSIQLTQEGSDLFNTFLQKQEKENVLRSDRRISDQNAADFLEFVSDECIEKSESLYNVETKKLTTEGESLFRNELSNPTSTLAKVMNQLKKNDLLNSMKTEERYYDSIAQELTEEGETLFNAQLKANHHFEETALSNLNNYPQLISLFSQIKRPAQQADWVLQKQPPVYHLTQFGTLVLLEKSGYIHTI